jgi:hypothetical protein
LRDAFHPHYADPAVDVVHPVDADEDGLIASGPSQRIDVAGVVALEDQGGDRAADIYDCFQNCDSDEKLLPDQRRIAIRSKPQMDDVSFAR